MNYLRSTLIATAACLAVSSTARAEDTGVFSKGIKEATLDDLWSAATLYKDKSNPVVEEFDFIGRFQADYYNVDSDKGDNDFLEIRRFRLGADAFFIDRHLELKAEVDTALHSYRKDELFYNRMTSLFANILLDDAFNIRVGKQEPHFGYDREQSDTVQPFFERSLFDDNVFNNTGADYQSAVTVYGKVGNFGYLASAISNDVDKEFGDFHGGNSYLGEVSYDFKKDLHADKALWVLDYIHVEPNASSDVFNTINNAVATYFDYKQDKFGLVGQIGFADGTAAKGDFYHIMVMPTYDITSKLQAVFRYQNAHGSHPNTLGTLNRQDATVGKFTGDTYNAAYLGVNYKLYGDKLKLMAGTEYFDMDGGTGAKGNNAGWDTMVGVRMYW